MFTAKGFSVDKIWFRSIATVMESKIPTIKAKVITKLLGDQKDSKNCYVLLKTKEMAEKAVEELNQKKFGTKHIRVDIDFKDENMTKANDFETTVFIGNLPFIVSEEDVRDHFLTCF